MKGLRLSVVLAVRLLAAFFLVAGIAALVVGVHDVLLPGSRLGVLFPGILLVLAGALFLGAVWQLLPIARSRSSSTGKPPACEQPVPVAFLVSILLGVYIFFGALAGAGTQRGIVIGVSLVFMAVGFAGFALFWDDIEVSLVRVGAGIALTVAGLLIGGWEFWYQNQYVPSHLDRAVSVTVGLKKLHAKGRYDVLSATLGYGDVGGRAIVVLGSDYTLTGSVVVACPRPATPDLEAKVFGGQLPDPQRSRFTSTVWEIQPAKVLAAGRFVADGKRLGPNVPASRQMIFYVPHDRHQHRYQLLRLRAQVFAISASVPLANQPPVRRHIKGDMDVYDLWKLAPSGWFQNLLSGSRGWIVTRYEIVNPQGKGSASGGTTSSPDLRVTAQSPRPTWSGKVPSNAQIENLFALDKETLTPLHPPLDTTETFADTELPLAPVRAPTAKELTKNPKTCAHDEQLYEALIRSGG
jgi:hypothetical protein